MHSVIERVESEGPSACQVIHLNGSILQKEHGFLLSRGEYRKAQIRNIAWYQASAEDYFNYTPVFIGASLNEPLLEVEIERAKEAGRGHAGVAYAVTPHALTPIQEGRLKSQDLLHLSGTLEDFVSWLGSAFPKGLALSEIRNPLSNSSYELRDLADKDFDRLRSFWPCDYQTIARANNFMTAEEINKAGRKFYSGFGPDWPVVHHDIFCVLAEYEQAYAEFLNYLKSEKRLAIVIGQAGSGKSTCARFLVHRLSKSDPSVSAVHFSQRHPSVLESFRTLARVLPGKCALVHVDDLHAYADDLGEVLSQPWSSNLKIISSARLSDWDARLARQIRYDAAVKLKLSRFSEKDAPCLIDKLVKYVPVPALFRLDDKQRKQQLMRSKRQLLIAMKEATSSREFDSIIEDEFSNISGADTKCLFLMAALATLARCGISESTASAIFSALFPTARIDVCRASLEGIVETGSNGRLGARHELYVTHIVEKVCETSDLVFAWRALLQHFSTFDLPIIRNVSKLDGQLFKFLINNRFVFRIFGRRDALELAEEMYRAFDVKFQLDGHFWLQFGLFMRRLSRHDDALEMLRKSLQAYPDNDFAQHAYAQQLFLNAGMLPVGDGQAQRLVDEGVATFLSLHARTLKIVDRYPLITLAFYHIPFLLKANKSQAARNKAAEYFELLKELEKLDQQNRDIDPFKIALVKLASTGVWERPNIADQGEFGTD